MIQPPLDEKGNISCIELLHIPESNMIPVSDSFVTIVLSRTSCDCRSFQAECENIVCPCIFELGMIMEVCPVLCEIANTPCDFQQHTYVYNPSEIPGVRQVCTYFFTGLIMWSVMRKERCMLQTGTFCALETFGSRSYIHACI